jgi:hypothetical protein
MWKLPPPASVRDENYHRARLAQGEFDRMVRVNQNNGCARATFGCVY